MASRLLDFSLVQWPYILYDYHKDLIFSQREQKPGVRRESGRRKFEEFLIYSTTLNPQLTPLTWSYLLIFKNKEITKKENKLSKFTQFWRQNYDWKEGLLNYFYYQITFLVLKSLFYQNFLPPNFSYSAVTTQNHQPHHAT